MGRHAPIAPSTRLQLGATPRPAQQVFTKANGLAWFSAPFLPGPLLDAERRLWDLLLSSPRHTFAGHSTQETRAWLAFLATQLKRLGRQRFMLHELYILDPDQADNIRRFKLVVGLRGGLFVGLLFGLLGGLLNGPLVGLIGGLFVGLILGLIFGLIGGLDAWLYHHWLRTRLDRRGELPRKLSHFLLWCADPSRSWMRITNAYEFRHRELLDYLAPEQQVATESTAQVGKRESSGSR